MCMVKRGRVQVSHEFKKFWKVVFIHNGIPYLIYRSYDGREREVDTNFVSPWFIPRREYRLVSGEATKHHGFSAFLYKQTAEKYATEIYKEYFPFSCGAGTSKGMSCHPLRVIPVWCPPGGEWYCGVIGSGFIGGGMEGVALSEILIDLKAIRDHTGGDHGRTSEME